MLGQARRRPREGGHSADGLLGADGEVVPVLRVGCRPLLVGENVRAEPRERPGASGCSSSGSLRCGGLLLVHIAAGYLGSLSAWSIILSMTIFERMTLV